MGILEELDYIKKIWSFILGGVIFVSFVLYTGGVVQGDTSHHPIGLHLGNIWLFLFTFFFIFLFYNITGEGRRIKRNFVDFKLIASTEV